MSKREIYKEYLKNSGSDIDFEKRDKWGKTQYEIFNSSYYIEIIDKLIDEYSKDTYFHKKTETIKLINKKPGFFSKSIWNNINTYDRDEVIFGYGDNDECIVFLDRHIKIHFEVDRNNTGIHCGTDTGWMESEVNGNTFSTGGIGGLHFREEPKNFVLKNQSILKIISRFIDLRIEQVKRLSSEYKDKEIDRLNILDNKRDIHLKKLDNDGNGIIDIIEGQDDFLVLVKKHQKKVLEKQRGDSTPYPQHFIKIGNYIKDKKQNLQSLFEEVKLVENDEHLEMYTGIIQNEIHVLNLLLFNSLNMVTSLVEDDIFTFYEIYEQFDKLGIFNSHWENDVTNRLEKLEEGLESLMIEIHNVGSKIIQSINQLSYVNEETNKILESHLSSIDSTLLSSNLLTLIQTYQVYKINQNTKSLRE